MQRYSVQPDCSCGCRGNEDIFMYIKDDFKINYKFLDHRYNPVLVVPPKYVDCVFEYSILGRPELYIASNINGCLTNCIIDEATNELKVIFENHGLKPGKLMVKYQFLIKDPEFPTSRANRYDGAYTGIILTDNLY